MMNSKQRTVFREEYGEIPRSLWQVMRKYNITPAEFYILEDQCLGFEWMEFYIKSNITSDGIYRG